MSVCVCVCVRQEKADLAPTSRPSATSCLTGTTCSFRPPLRPTSRYGLNVFSADITGLFPTRLLLSLVLTPTSCLLQLSGTDILDTIDSEATGTLKDCYVTLGRVFFLTKIVHLLRNEFLNICSCYNTWCACVCVLSFLQSGVLRTHSCILPGASMPP